MILLGIFRRCAKRKIVAEIDSTQSVYGAKKLLKNSAEDKQEELFDAKCRHDSSK